MTDVVVVGGGPVGLAAAIAARLAGMDVVLMEPRAGAVDKACGEGLMPEALRLLAGLGVDPSGQELGGIRYLQRDRSVVARFSHGTGRGVRRTTLHDALRQRAADVGVRVEPRRVVEVRTLPDRAEVDGIAARYVLAADGLHSSIRAALGLRRPPHGPARFGVRRHLQVEPWTDLVEVHWTERAEVYVTPVGPDTVGIAVLGRRPLSLDSQVAAVPALASRLDGARRLTADRGAGPLRQRASAPRSGRVLLVGDAAGYVDALTGEGLRLGLATAIAAVDAVAGERPDEYDAEWRRLTRSYRALTGGLLWAATTPGLRSLVVPAARTLPWAFRRAVDALAGDGAGLPGTTDSARESPAGDAVGL